MRSRVSRYGEILGSKAVGFGKCTSIGLRGRGENCFRAKGCWALEFINNRPAGDPLEVVN